MTIGTILVILLVLALVGVIPTWGYSSGWGYGPSGGIGLVLLIVLILILTGTVWPANLTVRFNGAVKLGSAADAIDSKARGIGGATGTSAFICSSKALPGN